MHRTGEKMNRGVLTALAIASTCIGVAVARPPGDAPTRLDFAATSHYTVDDSNKR